MFTGIVMTSCSSNIIATEAASQNNESNRYGQKEGIENETFEIGSISTRENSIQKYRYLLREMEGKGYDVSRAKDLAKKSRQAKNQGDRRKARRLFKEAISALKSLETGTSAVPSSTVEKENQTDMPVELSAGAVKVTIPVNAEKVMVIDSFPSDTNEISRNVLENFHYYEQKAKEGTVVLDINSPVIVAAFPYPDFKLKNNKAFGSTESGQVNAALSGLSDSSVLNSRQAMIIDLISQAGIGIARDFKSYDTYRFNIESQKGHYDFFFSDYAINLCMEKGIDFIGRITPHITRKGSGLPEDESAYIAYIKQTVNRYKGRVKYWQTLKEPEPRVRSHSGNDKGLMPEDAVRILKLSYTTIKSIDKDAIVYFPGTGPPFEFRGYNADSYFEKIISLGGAMYFDVLGFDAYKYDIGEQVIKYREILKKYGYDKPLWVAQTGVPDEIINRRRKPSARRFSGGGSPSAQCEYLVKAYAGAFALGIEKVFWGEFLDESEAESKNRGKSSLQWDRTGLFFTGTWEKKPAYFTHRLLAATLYGFTKTQKIAPNIVKFIFAGKSPVYILWPD